MAENSLNLTANALLLFVCSSMTVVERKSTRFTLEKNVILSLKCEDYGEKLIIIIFESLFISFHGIGYNGNQVSCCSRFPVIRAVAIS